MEDPQRDWPSCKGSSGDCNQIMNPHIEDNDYCDRHKIILLETRLKESEERVAELEREKAEEYWRFRGLKGRLEGVKTVPMSKSMMEFVEMGEEIADKALTALLREERSKALKEAARIAKTGDTSESDPPPARRDLHQWQAGYNTGSHNASERIKAEAERKGTGGEDG